MRVRKHREKMHKIISWMILALALAIALAVFAFLRSSAPGTSPEDVEARRIVDSCAMGASEAGRAGLSVNLARRLRDLHAETAVTSGRVGAILDKIGPDAIGAAMYATYVQCLRQQTELSLIRSGIRIESSPPPPPAPVSTAQPVGGPTSSPHVTTQAAATSARPDLRSRPAISPEAAAQPQHNRTEGNCSPIIVGGHIENFSEACGEH